MTVLVACTFGLFVLGLHGPLMGMAWPTLSLQLHQSMATMGIALFCMTGGNLAAGFVVDLFVRIFGRTGALLIASGCGVLSLLLCASAQSWLIFLMGCSVLGFCDTLLNSTVTAYVSCMFGARGTLLIHGAWGVGAATTAFVAGLAGSWHALYVVVAAGQMGLVASIVLTGRKWPPTEREETVATKPVIAHKRRLLASLMACACYGGAEMGVGQFAASWLHQSGLSTYGASLYVSIYWGALTVGRLLMATIGRWLTTDKILAIGIALATAGTATLLVHPIGLALIGLGLSAILPTLMAIVPDRFGAQAAYRVTGLQDNMEMAGENIFPAAGGVVYAHLGLGWLPFLTLVPLGGMLVALGMSGHFGKFLKKKHVSVALLQPSEEH